MTLILRVCRQQNNKNLHFSTFKIQVCVRLRGMFLQLLQCAYKSLWNCVKMHIMVQSVYSGARESPFLTLPGVQRLLVHRLHCEQQGIIEQTILHHTIMLVLPNIIHAGRMYFLSSKIYWIKHYTLRVSPDMFSKDQNVCKKIIMQSQK